MSEENELRIKIRLVLDKLLLGHFLTESDNKALIEFISAFLED